MSTIADINFPLYNIMIDFLMRKLIKYHKTLISGFNFCAGKRIIFVELSVNDEGKNFLKEKIP